MQRENQLQSSSTFSDAPSQNGLTALCGRGGQTPINQFYCYQLWLATIKKIS